MLLEDIAWHAVDFIPFTNYIYRAMKPRVFDNTQETEHTLSNLIKE